MLLKLFRVRSIKRNILILLAPFMLMVIVNECTRIQNKSNFKSKGFTILNTTVPIKNKCSWNCHNNTSYCIKHHIKLTKPYLNFTNPIYFGAIGALMSTGNYGLANILFLVILMPLWMFYFLVKSIDLIIEIEKNKKWNQ
jgi:hypothetical protein